MFDNKDYVELSKEIVKKRNELLDEEYCLLRNWQVNLDFYLKDVDYVLINDCMWVKIDKIESGTIRLGKNHSNGRKTPSWYRIVGLVVFDDDTDEINRTFAPGISINITDTVKKIDEEVFNQALQERCSKVFADTEKNFKIQYYHYHYRFHDYVLEKYPDLFPQQVHDFLNRLEAKLDEELNSNYKGQRDSKDELIAKINEVDKKVDMMAAVRPYQDALINCKIDNVALVSDLTSEDW